MKKIYALFLLVLLAALLFFLLGWSYSFYEELQIGMLILSALIGGYIILRPVVSAKKCVVVVVGVLVGNWGIFTNLAHALYLKIFGFV
jgi:hypothetical protein